MTCPYCGKTIEDNSIVCIFCERLLSKANTLQSENLTPSKDTIDRSNFKPSNDAPTEKSSFDKFPDDDQGNMQIQVIRPYSANDNPISEEMETGEDSQDSSLTIGTYLGIIIVSLIPVIGLIFLLIWVCSSKGNKNRSNLAAALLILKLVGVFFLFGIVLAYFLLQFPFYYYMR